MRHLPTLIVLALLGAAGAAHGYLTNRWGVSRELEESVARLPKVPLDLGEWQGEDVAPDETQKTQLERAQAVSALMRRYRSRRTGEAVSVLLVSGRPGPIATHTPEVCYGNIGYEPTGSPARYTPPSSSKAPAEFWYADFRKAASVAPTYLRIYWTWGTREGWKAVDNPRVSFASSRALFKIYVLRETTSTDPPDEADAGSRLIRALLPALDETLFDHGQGPTDGAGVQSP